MPQGEGTSLGQVEEDKETRFESPFVEIIVGGAGTSFRASRKDLARESAIFRDSIFRPYDDFREPVLYLRRHNPMIVELVILWLSTGDLHLPLPNPYTRFERRFQILAEVFVFAESFEMPNLRDDVISMTVGIGQRLGSMASVIKKYPPPETVKYIYAETDDFCIMRQLMVHYFVWYCGGLSFDEPWFLELRRQVRSFDKDLVESDSRTGRNVRNLFELDSAEVCRGCRQGNGKA
ncbi:hypothetical protein VTO42DRAFT_192 [Malbranchea cinnamomea]